MRLLRLCSGTAGPDFERQIDGNGICRSDVLDCQWIRQLLWCGLLRGPFRPDGPASATSSPFCRCSDFAPAAPGAGTARLRRHVGGTGPARTQDILIRNWVSGSKDGASPDVSDNFIFGDGNRRGECTSRNVGRCGLRHRAGSLARCNRETATIHGPCRRIRVQRRVDRGGRISRPHPDFEQGAGKDSQVLLIR